MATETAKTLLGYELGPNWQSTNYKSDMQSNHSNTHILFPSAKKNLFLVSL